jgi:lipopolysaccharide export system permease protein
MRQYSWYLFKSVFGSFAVILLSLLGLVWIAQSLKIIDMIVNKGIGIGTFLKISLLLVPYFLYLITPIALLIAVIWTLHKLYLDRELVIIKNAGLSNFQIAKPILLLALIITIFNYMVSLSLLPYSYKKFRDLEFFIKNNYASLFLQEGAFNTQVKGLAVYVDSKEDFNTFKGIFVHDKRHPKKDVTLIAESGELMRTENGPKLLLKNGSSQEQRKDGSSISLLLFDNYDIELSLIGIDKDRKQAHPNEKSAFQLIQDHNAESYRRLYMKGQGHHRLVWPAYALLLAALSSSLMLSGEINRRYFRIKNVVISLLAGACIVGSLIFQSLSMRNIWWAAMMYGNALVFAVLSWKAFVYGYNYKWEKLFAVSHRLGSKK